MQKLSVEDVTVLEGLRARMMPLRYNIESLQHEMARNPGNPPSWPEIQRATAVLNSHIHSLQQYINGTSSEVIEDGHSTTKVTPGQHAILRSLHPYPTPPFTFEQNGTVGLVETLLRKKPGPKEEKWVADRLLKASEFCHVPGDWGIEARTAGHDDSASDADEEEKEKDANDDDDDDDDEAGFKITQVERRLGTLTEDELLDMWDDANNQAQIAAKNIADENMALEEEEEEEGSESESESPADEMEDVKVEGSGAPSLNAGGDLNARGVGASATATGAVAKPLPKSTTLPLDFILKFMSTGATEW